MRLYMCKISLNISCHLCEQYLEAHLFPYLFDVTVLKIIAAGIKEFTDAITVYNPALKILYFVRLKGQFRVK